MSKQFNEWHEDSPKDRELDRLFVESEAKRQEGYEYWKPIKTNPLTKPQFDKLLVKIKEVYDNAREEDEFRAFKFLTDNGLTITGKQPLDYYESLGKLTQKMKDYKNGESK